ncbi:hypothetical protein PoB_007447600 [Plakobranchus ocellatus]|uniref:Uncharacterized protein n=1 Tax=Plakobranchus ocellatus TaxID=259542 RepID=A0AAV4DVU5_9GAST|nr:hypothetical protein PoB_007447600 [Plakobranchus ocellatus]
MEAGVSRLLHSSADDHARDKNVTSVHNKMNSGFQALRQSRAPVAGLEPATEGSLQISGRLVGHCATDAPLGSRIEFATPTAVKQNIEGVAKDAG